MHQPHVPCSCHAIAMHLPCNCHAIAMLLPCLLGARRASRHLQRVRVRVRVRVAMQLPCSCHAVAMQLPCSCVCMRLRVRACACVCVRCIHIVSYIRHSVLIHDTTGEPLQSTPECYRMCVPTAVA